MQKILEYKDLFPNEELDIISILKKYSKKSILRMVSQLGINYGNSYYPDDKDSFFSSFSNKRSKTVKHLLNQYLKTHSVSFVCYAAQRSILELLRYTFSIPMNDFYSEGKDENEENDLAYDLFRILLFINQKLMCIVNCDKQNASTLVFMFGYVFNDVTNGDWRNTFFTQTYYFECLQRFLKDKGKELRNVFLQSNELVSIERYYQTLYKLICGYINKKKDNKGVCPILNLDSIKDRCVHKEVCNFLSININDEISYSSNDCNDRKNNVDYREFRAHPLIEIAENSFIFISLQLLCERIYNSLYFDLKDVWDDKNGNYSQFYNKEVIEHYIFQRTMLKCLGKKTLFSYPPNKDVLSPVAKQEKENEPDFYIRERGSLILFECKGVKINGIIKDRADADELMRVLRNKLYLSVENIDKSRKRKKREEKVGVTQLVKEMELIRGYSFRWDYKIPKNVVCYPVLVLEDPRLSQMGMNRIINEWYKPLLIEKGLKISRCRPVVVMSIDTLFLFSDVFKKLGFRHILNSFYKHNLTGKISSNEWEMNMFADFDLYMRKKYNFSSSKKNYYKHKIDKYTYIES